MSAPSASITSLADSLGIPPDDPNVSSALGSVAAQVQAEGGQSLDVNAAQSTLLHAYSSLTQQGNVDALTALNAAKAYVSQNQTVAGAIDTASGLVSAVSQAAKDGSSPFKLVTDFSGPLIGTLVLTDAISAGVGAAITGIVAGADALLDALNPPTPGVDIGGWVYPTQPDIVVGSVGATVDDKNAIAISPSSPAWRRFPEPSNSSDAEWFSPGDSSTGVIGAKWGGATWLGPPHSAGKRLIDAAFPAYAQVSETASVADVLSAPASALGISLPTQVPEELQAEGDLAKAYFTAWKANQEYFLNGRSGAKDWQVLAQVVRVWNRAHEPGKGIDVYPGSTPYYASQISGLVANPQPDVMSADGRGVHLNTGPLKQKVSPPAVTFVPFGLGVKTTRLIAGAPAGGSSSVVATLLVLLAAAAAGGGAWLLLGKRKKT